MRKYLISIAVCLICTAVFAPAAFAAVNLNSYSYYEFTYNSTYKEYVVDLDGDGVNEKLNFRDGYNCRVLNNFKGAYVSRDKRLKLSWWILTNQTRKKKYYQ